MLQRIMFVTTAPWICLALAGCQRQEAREPGAPTAAIVATPLPTLTPAPETPFSPASANPHVKIETSMGTMYVELYPDKAPITVENFMRYVKEGHYDGTIFHRVMPDFMIQGGGFTPNMVEKKGHEPIKNEADNGLRNSRGTIAMARTQDVDSATAQFYINVVDNAGLDHSEGNFGYAVFGRVVSGMDVADRIRHVSTGRRGMHENVPTAPVIIRKVSVLSPQRATTKPETQPS